MQNESISSKFTTDTLGKAFSNQKQPVEGELTKKIEKVTAQIPSVGYLGLALGSMALSIGFALVKERKDIANFVGLWVPSFLLLGIYNKIVKTEGSDQEDRMESLGSSL